MIREMPDDEQWDEYFVSRLRQAGTHIMGRVTYEGWAGFGLLELVYSPS